MFGMLKKAVSAATGEVAAARNENRDVLEAYCACAALIAMADGELEDSERSKVLRVLVNSKDLKGLFDTNVIERTFETMVRKASDSAGKQELIEEFEDLRKQPDSAKIRDRIFLFGRDIAMADGEMEEAEEKRLNVIAKILDVDPKKFLLEGF